MKSIIKARLPPPPPCSACSIALTDCIQANTRGMLIMPAHDISKISPPILFKQLSGAWTRPPLHLGPLAWRMLFSVWGMGWCGPVRSSIPTIHFPGRWFLCQLDKKEVTATVYLQLVQDGVAVRALAYSVVIFNINLPRHGVTGRLFAVRCHGDLSCAKNAPVIAGVGERLRSGDSGLTLRTRKWEWIPAINNMMVPDLWIGTKPRSGLRNARSRHEQCSRAGGPVHTWKLCLFIHRDFHPCDRGNESIWHFWVVISILPCVSPPGGKMQY